MALAQREVADLGCRPPLGIAVVLWLNALVSASLGIAFAWAGVGAATTAFDLGAVVVYLVCALACVGFAGWLAWMSHCESRPRVIADRDGVVLRTRGRSRHAWTDIDRFEVGKLFGEGVVRMEAVDGHCGVMVLCSGERVVLRALRTHAPFGGVQREEIAARVTTLNALLAARRTRGGKPTVLQSRGRC